MKLERAQRLREYYRDEAAFEGLQQLFNTLEANHRQAQEQILFLASLLDQVCHAIIATDKHSQIIYWNCYAQTLYQWQAEEVMGKSINDTLAAQVNHQQAEATLSAVKSTGSAQREFVAQRKDGSQFVAEVSDAVLRDSAGNLIGFVGIYADATERNRVEEALRKSEERYRALYEENPSIYFTIDAGGTVLSVNAFGAEQLAYPPEELVGQSFLKVVYEDDKPAVQQHLIACLQQPAAVSRREVRQVRKDGSLLWVRQVARAVPGNEGNLIVLMLCEEITEQKQAQETRLQRETKNTALPQALPDLMFQLDKNSSFLDFAPESKHHNSFLNFNLHKKSAVASLSTYNSHSIASYYESPTYFKASIVVSNELEHQVQKRTSHLKKALEFAAGIQHITNEIRDSFDEAQILQTAVVALHSILKTDYCCAALYNLERTQATICYEATPPQFGSALGCAIKMADAPNAFSRLLRGEYYQSSEQGDLSAPELCKHLPVKLLCPISSDDQGVIAHLAVFNRIGTVLGTREILLVQQVANQCAIAIRQARLYQASRAQVEELAKLNRLKDDFLSTVSHELRSPIANMKMAIHLLQAADDPDRRERYLKILRNECDRENELIEDLLDLQRLEADAYGLHTTAVNLPQWLPTILAPFNCRISHRQQILEVDYPPELPPFISDAISLGRIITELLNNACKYTSAGGKIALSVRYSEGGGESLTPNPSSAPPVCLFTIVNQAEIPKAELPRIFEKFYRVPNADPWQQGGTGLGLALVYKLVEQLGGSIQVESDAGWTAFTVALPTYLKEKNEP
ncbi:MAG: PAS domain S-box protein [Microcoleus vaginatus WJT46-NPBG5]|jgi:PAS domain S-box-containing protein|nr:PAS domain S-box protein [Microcoleus vaginatus WJT46-NPBG5]